LKELKPDIIGFQELWHPNCLRDIFSEADLDSQYELVTTGSSTGSISSALAIRSPNQKLYTRWIKDFPSELVLKKRLSGSNLPDYEISIDVGRFSRAILRVTVGPDTGPNIVVLVAHLKSKRPMSLDSTESSNNAIRPHSSAIGYALSTIRRTAEAAALRVILNKIMRDTHTPVIAMGDLNDSQLSVTTAIITGQPKYRLFESSRIGNRSDRGLYSVANLQEYRSLRDVYYTYIHNSQRESLDHILVSEQFYDYSSNRVWSFKEARIINDHLDDNKRATSDHGIVCATFEHNPA
jgi:endonuclease/exonuclease/phosphatase family metal-dependent hydrolase